MSASYEVVGQRPDIQIVGNDKAVDVQRITARTVPHAVIFDYLAPEGSFIAKNVDTYLEPYAAQIEYYLNSGRAIGAEYVEELNDNGLIGFFIDFTVQTPPVAAGAVLPQVATVRVALEALGERLLIDAVVEPAFEKVESALQAVARL